MGGPDPHSYMIQEKTNDAIADGAIRFRGFTELAKGEPASHDHLQYEGQQVKGCPTNPCTNVMQKCQGDPCHRMSHCRKEIGAGLYLRPPPTIPFLPWSSSAFPLAFLSAFVHGLVGQPLTCWNTVLIEIARAFMLGSLKC